MARKIIKGCIILLCASIGAVLLWFGGIVYESCVDYLHGDLEWVQENDVRHLQYKGNKYYKDEQSFLRISYDAPETDLAWHYNLPFTTKLRYTAPDAVAPAYIYNGISVYLREDLDIMDEVFCVEETGEEFVLGDVLTKVEQPVDWDAYTKSAGVDLYMKDTPYILFSNYAWLIDGEWYILAYIHKVKTAWHMADELAAALETAGQLPATRAN